MSRATCGGCRGEGAHSPRCFTQPGALWRQLAEQAKNLGDSIGPNDMEAANAVWAMSSRFRQRWHDAVAANDANKIKDAAQADDPPPPWMSALWRKE